MTLVSLAAWITAHADFIIVVVSLMFVAPFLHRMARAVPSVPSGSLLPAAQLYSSLVAVAFTVVFVKSLVQAIDRSNAASHDGGMITYVVLGYAWCAFWFTAAFLGFIAARKG